MIRPLRRAWTPLESAGGADHGNPPPVFIRPVDRSRADDVRGASTLALAFARVRESEGDRMRDGYKWCGDEEPHDAHAFHVGEKTWKCTGVLKL
jgi:hypothetical protein